VELGRGNLARYVSGLVTKFAGPVSLDVVESNGREAILGSRGGSVLALCAIDASPAGIERVLVVLNLAKLTRFNPVRRPPAA
jgi:RNA polymerase sigma-70 factor (ECF subfamily)